MPSWNIHLEVGRKLNQKLKFVGKQKEEFLFGCILPDINNGFVNKGVKNVKQHDETHWAFDEKSSLNFYAKYKNEIDIKRPIYLGYLLHLYTDGYFNFDYYRKVDNDERYQNLSHEQKKKNKHHDFWKYNIKLKNVKIEVSNKKEMAELANEIQDVQIDEEEITEVEDIINDEDFNRNLEDEDYIFYTEKKLDELVQEVVESFFEKYLEEKNA